MGFKLVSVLVVAFVVIAAGCGGSKKKSAAPTSTAAATTAATAAATTAATTTTAAAPTFATTKNCAQLIGLAAKLSQAFQTTSGNIEASLANEAKVLQALAAAAPSEIRADFTTLADAFTTYAQAVTKAGIKPGATPTATQLAQLSAAAKSFSTPKLQAAEQRLSAWGRKNCGFGGTTTSG